MPGRSFTSATGYRYGFNGKENDDEVKGIKGSQQDYGMRIYDPRLGRFLSVDPLAPGYPELTPYQFSSNRPLDGIDLDGKEWQPAAIATVLLVLSPTPASAPSWDPRVNGDALARAYDLQTKWIAFALGGAGAAVTRLSATTIAKELSKQFVYQYAANIAIQGVNKVGTGQKIDFKEAFISSINGVDFADALLGSTGLSLLSRNILSAVVDITPEEAKLLGVDKSVGSATIDYILNTIGDKVPAPDMQYKGLVDKLVGTTQNIVNKAIQPAIDEANRTLDIVNTPAMANDETTVFTPPPKGVKIEK